MSLFEIAIILVVALIIFGPEQLPDIARQIGKFMGQIRRTSDSFRREFYNEIYPPADEIKRSLSDTSRELRTISQDLRDTARADKALFDGKSAPVENKPAAPAAAPESKPPGEKPA